MASETDFLLAEYVQLRTEILKRSEIQHQLISIALVALGGLIAVGLRDSPAALMAYPMLAVFLSAGWSYNDIQIAQLGIYIRHRIEPRLAGPGLGWEHAILLDSASKRIGARTRFATRGILLATEVLTLALYLVKRASAGFPEGAGVRNSEAALLTLSVAAVVFTFVILRDESSLIQAIDASMRQPAADQRADRVL